VPDRRRRRLAAVLALPLWLATFVLVTVGARPASAGTVTTPTSCTNNAQAGTTALAITVAGDYTRAGSAVTLSGATFKIDVPGAVLVTGYRLGLLTAGSNSIPADVNVTLLGTGTQPADQVLGPIAVTGTTTISDPTPASKNSGDETATPLSVTATIPTSTWTATGTDVALRLGTSTTTAKVGPGGVLPVTFECTPGTPTPSGCGAAPLPACTGTNPVPAQPFATGAGATTTTTTTGGSTTTTTGGSTTTTTGPSTTTTTTGATTTTTTTGATTAATTTTTVAASAAPSEVSGTASYPTSCRNSVTPDLSELLFEASGRTTSPIAAGGTATLTGQSWKVTVPGSVLQTGVGLGLVKPGDTPTGVAAVTVSASNTRQGTRTVADIPLSIGPVVVTGGQAQAATTTFAVPDMSFTATGGDVRFAMAATSVEVTLGPIEVTFTCEPKAPVATIVTAAVRGAGAPASVAGVSTSRPAGGTLARTGPSALAKLVLAAALIDVGYLCWSAARPRRRPTAP
jgi:hypothetical protein